MSGYNPRRTTAPYLAGLNTIPSPTDTSNQPSDSYNLDDDLALFTNADFDFDIGHTFEQQPPVTFDASAEELAKRENAYAKSASGNGKDLEINTGMCNCVWCYGNCDWPYQSYHVLAEHRP